MCCYTAACLAECRQTVARSRKLLLLLLLPQQKPCSDLVADAGHEQTARRRSQADERTGQRKLINDERIDGWRRPPADTRLTGENDEIRTEATHATRPRCKPPLLPSNSNGVPRRR